MQATGRRAHVLLDFETTYNQDPASPNGIKIPFQTAEIKSTQNLNDDETIRNDRNPAQPSRGYIDVNGPLVVPVDVKVIGYLLKAMLNSPVTSGTGPYTHEFKLGNAQPSLVIEQGFTDIASYHKYNGCKISKFSMEFGGEGDQIATFEVIGAKETIGGTSYDSTPLEIPITKFSRFQASIKEGGISTASVTKATLEADLNLDTEGYALGSNGERVHLPEGIVKISGNLTAFFENQALLNKAINGTTSSLNMKLDNSVDSLEFVLPELIYEKNSPGISGSKGILVELPYRAFYHSNADATALKAILINGVDSY